MWNEIHRHLINRFIAFIIVTITLAAVRQTGKFTLYPKATKVCDLTGILAVRKFNAALCRIYLKVTQACDPSVLWNTQRDKRL